MVSAVVASTLSRTRSATLLHISKPGVLPNFYLTAMPRFSFPLTARLPLLCALVLLCLTAMAIGAGLNGAGAKPNRHQARAPQQRVALQRTAARAKLAASVEAKPAVAASSKLIDGAARDRIGKGNVYEGYTLVESVSIMIYPHGVPGETVQGYISVTGSGSGAIAVTLSGPGISADNNNANFNIAPGQRPTFNVTLPTTLGTPAVFTARTAGREIRGTVVSGSAREATATVTVAKRHWSAAPALAPLRLLANSIGPSTGHNNGGGVWGYAPGARVRVLVDQEEAEGVTDFDTYTFTTEVENRQVEDELLYQWSRADGGGTATPMEEPDGTPPGNSQEFIMPAQVGATITVTVTITDRATIDPAIEDGTRSDGPQTLTLTLVSQQQGTNGGGIGGTKRRWRNKRRWRDKRWWWRRRRCLRCGYASGREWELRAQRSRRYHPRRRLSGAAAQR